MSDDNPYKYLRWPDNITWQNGIDHQVDPKDNPVETMEVIMPCDSRIYIDSIEYSGDVALNLDHPSQDFIDGVNHLYHNNPAVQLPGNLSTVNGNAIAKQGNPEVGDITYNEEAAIIQIWNGTFWDNIFTKEELNTIYAQRMDKEEHPDEDRFQQVIEEQESIQSPVDLSKCQITGDDLIERIIELGNEIKEKQGAPIFIIPLPNLEDI